MSTFEGQVAAGDGESFTALAGTVRSEEERVTMIFLTDDECREWCRRHNLEVTDGIGKSPVVRVDLNVGGFTTLAASRAIEDGIGPWNVCLLWITLTDVWPSSTNLHLYYRLRQSYSDLRLLHQASGHLFLSYEDVDLTTFIQVGILSGWDMHLLTDLAYGRAFVHHDGWVDLWRSNENDLTTVQDAFRKLVGYEPKVQLK